MWLSKFLDLEEDIEELSTIIEKEIFKTLHKSKLTPLEFTVIETIFNSKQLSGYDLIKNLNRSFAGTWEAQSGTIYPILRKLEKDGFLNAQKVRSPIGPIKKVYSLTEAGDELLKYKVSKNYYDQLKFVENFLVELSSIFIRSFPRKEQSQKIAEIKSILNQTLTNVMQNIPPTLEFKTMCNKCGAEIGREVAYCPQCGESLFTETENK